MPTALSANSVHDKSLICEADPTVVKNT